MPEWIVIPPALPAFLLASLLIELTPGPNMTWLAILTLSEGRSRGLQAVMGVGLGLAILGAAGAIGISEIVKNSRPVYEALRWAGIAFLVYLAWDGWRGETDGVEHVAGHRAFYRGLVTNMLNPKAAAFYITVLPAFLKDGTTSAIALAQQTWILTFAYVAVATSVHAGIVMLAAEVKPYLVDEQRAAITRKILSLALLFVAIWFAWTSGWKDH